MVVFDLWFGDDPSESGSIMGVDSTKDGGGGGRAQLGESPTGGRDRTIEPFNPKT